MPGAWFKMSDAILDCDVMREISIASKGDSMADTRSMLFIRLITSALSPSKEFIDASALARFYGVSQRQADRVWDSCIRHGVLKKATYGYSARQWLVDNGFLGKAKTKEEKDADRAFMEGIYGR